MQRTICNGLILLAITLGGCALYEKTQDPDILAPIAKVTAVQVVKQTNEGATLKITLVLENPNALALPLTRASYSMTAGGAKGSYNSRPNCTLPSAGSQSFDLIAAIPATSSLSGAAVQVQGTITYNPPGEVRKLLTESNVPLPTTSFSFSGSVQ